MICTKIIIKQPFQSALKHNEINRFTTNTEYKWECLNEKNHYVSVIKLYLAFDPACENSRQANVEARPVEGECPSQPKLF